ncbi:MAG TPA: type II toxin-antitoxin system HicB family antitoxin [Thermoanaerobaculia bacterium]|nr:type II toxin-antitoxin system HicB family antitoxin [Thermoanaerobaculia bacterium]
MHLTLQLDRETDGRFIAEVRELPGVLVYGDSEDEAERAACALALRVIADRLEVGEWCGEPLLTIHVARAAQGGEAEGSHSPRP